MTHHRRRRVSSTLSPKAKDCLRYLAGCAVVGVDSDVEVYSDENFPSKIVIAVVHDSSGFDPLAKVCISGWMSEHAALEDAYDSLYHHYLDNYYGYVKEVMEESGGEYDHTEGWDGSVFTLPFKEAVSVILQLHLRGAISINKQDVLNIGHEWLWSEGFL